MKYNKLKAFTLAEVMILLLTLSILMAAFAPVFTRRYSNAGLDDVWTYVTADDNFDAYYDVLGKTYTAQAYIGLTPKDKYDVTTKFSSYSSNGSDPLYSKLVIAASKKLDVAGSPVQNQMQFRYGNSAAGDLVGSLFAGNGNMLVGGLYNNITNTAVYNSSFGVGSLAKNISTGLNTGKYNTAIGYNSLGDLSSGEYNTAIGYNSGLNISSAVNNTFIGALAGQTANGNNNLAVGYNAGNVMSGNYNTAVGISSMAAKSDSGDYNIAVGNYSLNKLSSGSGNTAIGYEALGSLTSGSYNTAVGSHACMQNTGGSYTTCIGFNSGASENLNKNVFKGSDSTDEVVLIGSYPVQTTDSYAAAILEVHNRSTKFAQAGNESVVINGNLIVRGQSYMDVPLGRAHHSKSYLKKDGIIVPRGLVAMKTIYDANTNDGMTLFAGSDGSRRVGRHSGECSGRCKGHAADYKRGGCICTVVAGGSSGGSCSPVDTAVRHASTNGGPSKSYDWTTDASNSNGINNCKEGNASYRDGSFGCTITLERAKRVGDGNIPGTDVSTPHRHGYGGGSCCPNLKTSDIRLKNVGEQFTAGLDEIKKLKVYNYTFKNDPNKLPHVGVIAQDLKMVFPNAVSKDDNGYYKIRWDEMFYAAINAVKTLNTKVQKLASRVAADKERVAVLKRDNDALNAQLDKLADEVTKLEAKKH